MRKKDIALIAGLLILAFSGLFLVIFLQRDEGARVIISVDGRETGHYDLSEDNVIEIENDFGYNKVVISRGSVSVEEADCPDLVCVHHAQISRNHESIICLPHRLVVEIRGGEASDVDAQLQ